MIVFVVVPVEGPPQVKKVPTGWAAYPFLTETFPEGFDRIHLAHDVLGYVGDQMLLDGSPANDRGKRLADEVYHDAAGRPYHTAVNGVVVVTGVDRAGRWVSVPGMFLNAYLPDRVWSPDGTS